MVGICERMAKICLVGVGDGELIVGHGGDDAGVIAERVPRGTYKGPKASVPYPIRDWTKEPGLQRAHPG